MANVLTKITARAKQIHRAHPSKKWTDCIKQASKELKGAKKPAKKSAPKKRYQTGTSNKKRDSARKAKAPGKRVSKTGRVYYERRRNRSDKAGSLSGAGSSQDHAIQRVIMKRRLRVKGLHVDNDILDNELQRIYVKVTGRKVPSISRIRAMLKKGVSTNEIVSKL